MHNYAKFVTLEINAVISHAKTVQNAAGSFELSEGIGVGVHQLLRQAAKLTQDLQLQFLGHARQFCRTGWIENDLKRSHEMVMVERRALSYRIQNGSQSDVKSQREDEDAVESVLTVSDAFEGVLATFVYSDPKCFGYRLRGADQYAAPTAKGPY